MFVNGICQSQVYYIGNIVRINNGNCAIEFTFKKVNNTLDNALIQVGHLDHLWCRWCPSIIHALYEVESIVHVTNFCEKVCAT